MPDSAHSIAPTKPAEALCREHVVSVGRVWGNAELDQWCRCYVTDSVRTTMAEAMQDFDSSGRDRRVTSNWRVIEDHFRRAGRGLAHSLDRAPAGNLYQ